ncbi:Uncharacterised protein [Klebsiella pneumoniae]|nr:Uncharacterised protein [Klebsiella pneumoniae]
MQRRHGTDPGVALDKGRIASGATASADHSCRPARAVRSVSQASVTPSTILMGTATTVSHRVLLSSSPTRGRKTSALMVGQPVSNPNRHHKP